jgi:hypothetical protein
MMTAVAMMTVGETTMAAAVMTMAAPVPTTMGPVLTTMGLGEQIVEAPVMTMVPAMAQVHLATIATQTQPAAISPPAMTALMGRVPAPQMLGPPLETPLLLPPLVKAVLFLRQTKPRPAKIHHFRG